MVAQDLLDDLPLNAYASAVDDADFAKTAFDCLKEVFLHHNRDFLRLKRMQVNGILDRHFVHMIVAWGDRPIAFKKAGGASVPPVGRTVGPTLNRKYNKVPVMKFSVRTYGCQMNVADSSEMGRHLKARGLVYTEDPDEASILLVNTC